MVYITNHNADLIIENIDISKLNLEGSLFKNRNLFIFSKREVKRLLAYKSFMANSKDLVGVYKKIEMPTDKYEYLTYYNKPAYHSKADCSLLNSAFITYKIPEKIRQKGEESCKIFRLWFKKNRELLQEDEKTFYALLKSKFGVDELEKQSLENSGIQVFTDLTLEQIEQQLDKLINEANDYFFNSNHKPVLSLFLRRLYLANPTSIIPKEEIEKAGIKMTDVEIKKILAEFRDKYKNPITRLLKYYYRTKYNPELKYNENILEQLGFVPCKECCSKRQL